MFVKMSALSFCSRGGGGGGGGCRRKYLHSGMEMKIRKPDFSCWVLDVILIDIVATYHVTSAFGGLGAL